MLDAELVVVGRGDERTSSAVVKSTRQLLCAANSLSARERNDRLHALTRVRRKNPITSREGGATSIGSLQVAIWENGRVDLEELAERFRQTLQHSLYDLLTEFCAPFGADRRRAPIAALCNRANKQQEWRRRRNNGGRAKIRFLLAIKRRAFVFITAATANAKRGGRRSARSTTRNAHNASDGGDGGCSGRFCARCRATRSTAAGHRERCRQSAATAKRKRRRDHGDRLNRRPRRLHDNDEQLFERHHNAVFRLTSAARRSAAGRRPLNATTNKRQQQRAARNRRRRAAKSTRERRRAAVDEHPQCGARCASTCSGVRCSGNKRRRRLVNTRCNRQRRRFDAAFAIATSDGARADYNGRRARTRAIEAFV